MNVEIAHENVQPARYVVEHVARNAKGERLGMWRHYVATEERAKECVAKGGPDFSWRETSEAERTNLEARKAAAR